MKHMDRDQQIAALIRSEISEVEADRQRMGYELGSPGDANLQGSISGLRRALAFVDPNPQR